MLPALPSVAKDSRPRTHIDQGLTPAWTRGKHTAGREQLLVGLLRLLSMMIVVIPREACVPHPRLVDTRLGPARHAGANADLVTLEVDALHLQVFVLAVPTRYGHQVVRQATVAGGVVVHHFVRSRGDCAAIAAAAVTQHNLVSLVRLSH